MNIRTVLAMTPVYRETSQVIEALEVCMKEAKRSLDSLGIHLSHVYLDDGADRHFIPGRVCLVKHSKNKGLAHTLVEGYEALSSSTFDLVVRIDAQEHDPRMIPLITSIMEKQELDALFIPIVYRINGLPKPSNHDIAGWIHDLKGALNPIEASVIGEIYNQKFPLGFQAFRAAHLKRITRHLRGGIEIFEEVAGTPATWGLDLLAMIITAHTTKAFGFQFGGYAAPWAENRSPEKSEEQRLRAEAMVEVARKLGYF